jgi:hypothetical protein
MPIFYFHLYDDVMVADGEGIELADLDAARAAAVSNIRDILAEDVKRGRMPLGHRIEIADEGGAVVAAVAFRDAVSVQA